MDKIDYKKEYKDLYLPKTKPMIIDVPKMNFVSVSGIGDPNIEGGEYQKAMQILYGITFTIKMSKMGNEMPDGYHDYVLPPLEGLWDIELDEITDFGISDKSKFKWISMIRLPEYVTPEVFEWAKEKLTEKNPDIDFSKTKYLSYEEGLCAQIMHKGPYDDEPKTIKILTNFIKENGYIEDYDLDNLRFHHEIYLGDPRKSKPENYRTVIRHPIKKK